MPMLVPSPPLSLMTTVRRSAAARAVGVVRQLVGVGQLADRLDLALRELARLPGPQPLEVVRERRDADVGDAVVAHLLAGWPRAASSVTARTLSAT